ncbi:MAG: hypothetical protein ACD_79C00235G0008 [uncultured bacterium]|nr:MAG: hypothetical protein ACD_79C00235G0008 [uncultured bacterium]
MKELFFLLFFFIYTSTQVDALSPKTNANTLNSIYILQENYKITKDISILYQIKDNIIKGHSALTEESLKTFREIVNPAKDNSIDYEKLLQWVFDHTALSSINIGDQWTMSEKTASGDGSWFVYQKPENKLEREIDRLTHIKWMVKSGVKILNGDSDFFTKSIYGYFEGNDSDKTIPNVTHQKLNEVFSKLKIDNKLQRLVVLALVFHDYGRLLKDRIKFSQEDNLADAQQHRVISSYLAEDLMTKAGLDKNEILIVKYLVRRHDSLWCMYSALRGYNPNLTSFYVLDKEINSIVDSTDAMTSAEEILKMLTIVGMADVFASGDRYLSDNLLNFTLKYFINSEILKIAVNICALCNEIFSRGNFKKLEVISKNPDAEAIQKEVLNLFLEKYKQIIGLLIKYDEIDNVPDEKVVREAGHTMYVTTAALQIRNAEKLNKEAQIRRIEDLFFKDISQDKRKAFELINNLQSQLVLLDENWYQGFIIYFITAIIHDIGKFRNLMEHDLTGAQLINEIGLLDKLVENKVLSFDQRQLIMFAIKNHIMFGFIWSSEYSLNDSIMKLFNDSDLLFFLSKDKETIDLIKFRKLIYLISLLTTADIGGVRSDGGFLNIKNTEFRKKLTEELIHIADESMGNINLIKQKINELAQDPNIIFERIDRALGFNDKTMDHKESGAYAEKFFSELQTLIANKEIAIESVNDFNNFFVISPILLPISHIMSNLSWVPQNAATFSDFSLGKNEGAYHPNAFSPDLSKRINKSAVRLLTLILKSANLINCKKIAIMPEPNLLNTPKYLSALYALDLYFRNAYDIKKRGDSFYVVDKNNLEVVIPGVTIKINYSNNCLYIGFWEFIPDENIALKENEVKFAS